MHMRTSHGAHVNESWFTCKDTSIHCVVRLNESEVLMYISCVVVHMRMSHGAHVIVSWCTCE